MTTLPEGNDGHVNTFKDLGVRNPVNIRIHAKENQQPFQLLDSESIAAGFLDLSQLREAHVQPMRCQ